MIHAPPTAKTNSDEFHSGLPFGGYPGPLQFYRGDALDENCPDPSAAGSTAFAGPIHFRSTIMNLLNETRPNPKNRSTKPVDLPARPGFWWAVTTINGGAN